MTPDEALDRLDSTYHSPLLAVVRTEIERLRTEVEAYRCRRCEVGVDPQCMTQMKLSADLAAARDLLRQVDEQSQRPFSEWAAFMNKIDAALGNQK